MLVRLLVQLLVPTMPLNDLRIRKTSPADKPLRIADGGGLFIEIRPSGGKLWRYAYRLHGKQKLLALGSYPEVSLAEAREKHAAARKLVQAGNDPVLAKAQDQARAAVEGENTFQAIAGEWRDARWREWGESRRAQVKRYLDTVLFPAVGNRPIRSLTSADMLAVVRGAEKRGASVALLVHEIASSVFSYAIVTLRADTDPLLPIRGAVKRPAPVHAKAHDSAALSDLYSRVKVYTGSVVTRIAIELLMLTFVRTAELRGARWAEFDVEAKLWTIPAARMKKRRKHIVPLSQPAVDLLVELRPFTGDSELLFPNIRTPGKTMSRMTINRAIEYMGLSVGAITGHDFRATASTHLHEKGWADEIVDMQLAHASDDKTAAAYNHARYLKQRTEMMDYWGTYLAGRKSAAKPLDTAARKRKRPLRVSHRGTSSLDPAANG